MSDQVKKPFNGERKPFSGEKRSFGGDKKPYSGEKRTFSGDKKPYSGEKRSFGGDKKPFNGEKRSFSGDKKPFSGEKRSFGGEKKPFGGERKPFSGDRKPFGKPAGKPFGRPMEKKPEQPVSDGLPARRVALAVIREVTEKGAFASLDLNERLTRSGLSAADRRLAARLAYDTIEHMLYLDWALDQIMAKPDTDIKLRNILRLGACQILLEDRIPESAATNTAVNLCRELDMPGLAGVCNGILRNLIRKKDELVWPDAEKEPIKARSIRYSVPEWLVKRLDADWGTETADALMACHQQENVTVRPNMTKMDDAAFEALLGKKVWQHEKGALPHAWYIRDMADIGQDSDFLGGNFSIQGESSMMACMAVAPKRGMQVLDACAAPGGKACYMAEMMGGTGRVQAWELHEHRTKLIAAQAKRLGLENVRPMTRDAAKVREDIARTMDAVLLDAPCSGLGTMADKPDVKYRVTEESVTELVALQKQLLEACCTYVKPGGVLVYSTCSMLKAENEEQIGAFLERHPEFSLDKLPEEIPAQFREHADTGLQLLPHRDKVGGFYIARMRRAR